MFVMSVLSRSRALGAWLALLRGVLACFMCSSRSRAWRDPMFYELGVLTCLACFLKWRVWHALKNDQFKIVNLLSWCV